MPRTLLFVAFALTPALGAQQRPLPDPKPFLEETRKRLQLDDDLQSGYAYVERRRELKLDKSGGSTKETIKVFETYPGFPGERRWRRLIEEDGKPVPAAELAKQDRERQKKAEEYLRKKASQTESDRQKEARDREKRRRENAEAIDEIYRIYDIRMLGRETLEGHDTIAFSLTPRPRVKPRTRDGGIMQHFTGKAWVSESEYELVRLEIEAVDTVSIGLGLLARVHKGSRAAFQRRKVNGETWLPASATYTASARVLLVKSLRVGGSSEFSDYRKFSVDTATKYTIPK